MSHLPEEHVTLIHLAQRLIMTGDPEGADIALRASESQCFASGQHLAFDRVRTLRANAAVSMGRADYAAKLLRGLSENVGDVLAVGVLEMTTAGFRAWERRLLDRSPEYGRHFLPGFYLAIGRYCAALGHYRYALAALQRGALHDAGEGTLDTALRLATVAVLVERGDVSPALDQLTDLRSRGRQALGYSWPAVSELWAGWFTITGQYGAGLSELEQVAAWHGAHGLEHAQLRALLNLAQLRILAGQFGGARSAIDFVAQRTGDPNRAKLSREAAALLCFLEEVLRDLAPGVPPVAALWGWSIGTPGQQRTEPTQPLDIPTVGFLSRFCVATNRFRRKLGRVDVTQSEADLAATTAQMGHTDSRLVQAELRVSAAMLDQARGRLDDAIDGYRSVCPFLIEAGLRPRLCLVLRLLSDSERHAGRSAAAGADSSSSKVLFEQIRNSLPWDAQSEMLMSRWRLDESYLQNQCRSLLQEGGTQSPDDPRIVELVQSAYRTRNLSAGSRNHTPVEGVLPTSDLRTALLAFLIFDESSLAVCVESGRAFIEPIPATNASLRALTSKWHWIARVQWERGESSAKAETLEHLSQQLGMELGLDVVLEKLTSGVRSLRLAVAGSLRNIPFAACRTRGGYVAERYATSVDSGVQRTGSIATLGRVVGAASALRAGDLQAPGEIADLSWISDVRWLRRSGVAVRLLDPHAPRRDIIRDALRDAGMFHFVGHGVLDPDNPERTGLVLVTEDGVDLLTLEDIEQLVCPSLQHVTVTSCWGADSYALPGRSAAGIAESFSRAGAGSVLSSLWPADPVIAGRFTRAFTELLGQSRRDEALQQVQRELILENRPLADWAGWRLLGDPGALHLP